MLETKSINKEEIESVKFFNYIEYEKEQIVGSFSSLSNCLIKIVPLKLSSSTRLFGSKIGCITLNKILIHEAIIDKDDDSKYTEGQVLMEALVSDESLSMALFDSNAGQYPCSYSNLLGEDVFVNYESSKNKSANLIINESSKGQKSHFEELSQLLNNFLDSKSVGKVSKKESEEILNTIGTLTRNISINSSYSVQKLIEELEKDLVSVKVEITSTVDKLSKYYKEIDLIEGFSSSKKDFKSKFNLLKWIANGEFDQEQRLSLSKVLEDLIITTNDKDELKNYKSLLNEFSNPYIADESHNSSPSNGCFRVSKTQGDIELFGSHSTTGHFFTMSFSAGIIKENYGKNTFSSSYDLLTVALSVQEILLLLRGNSQSNFIPCTMIRFAGQSVPLSKQFKSEESKIIDFTKKYYKNISSELEESYLDIKEFLAKPVTKKSDKETLTLMIKDYCKKFSECQQSLNKERDRDFSNIQNLYQNKLDKCCLEATQKLDLEMKDSVLLLLK